MIVEMKLMLTVKLVVGKKMDANITGKEDKVLQKDAENTINKQSGNMTIWVYTSMLVPGALQVEEVSM